MNRRGFLGMLASAAVGACVRLKIPPSVLPAVVRDTAVRYRGVPFVFDQACAMNNLYFVNPRYLRKLEKIDE